MAALALVCLLVCVPGVISLFPIHDMRFSQMDLYTSTIYRVFSFSVLSVFGLQEALSVTLCGAAVPVSLADAFRVKFYSASVV